MSVLLEIDVPEPRIDKGRLVASVDGTSWDYAAVSGAWVDPITQTLMLAPLAVTPEWNTTFTGSYARLGKADYVTAASVPLGDSWVESPRLAVGDTYLTGLGTNESVFSATTYGINQPFWVSALIPGVESLSQSIAFECGWGNPTTPGTVSLRVWVSGETSVWKVDAGGIPRNVGNYSSSGAPTVAKLLRTGKKSMAQQTLGMLLIPCRGRELLVVTSEGGGFSHAFADLDALSTTNTITPAGRFWWRVPSGQPSVQCAPCRFKTAGQAAGTWVKLPYAPAGGRTFAAISASGQVGTGTPVAAFYLSGPDGVAEFAANGTDVDCRCGVNLTGDGTNTRTVYALDMVCAPTFTTTANQPFDLTPYVMALSVSVPENGAVTAAWEVKNPDQAEAAGAEKLSRIGDRPFRIGVDGVDILRGTTGRPGLTYGAAGKDGASRLAFVGFDRERDAALTTFRDTLPYDGLSLSTVLQQLQTDSGYNNTHTDITTDTFLLPYSPAVSLGEWALLPARGDTRLQWIEKLQNDYAATWRRGWGPTASGYKWSFRRPDTETATPALTLYHSRADAVAGSIAPVWVARRVMYSFRESPEEAEANQVTIVGYDRNTGRYLTSEVVDAPSQTPGTLPASRPDNWRGRLVSYQLIDPGIKTMDGTLRAADIISNRIMDGRDLVEWECELLTRASDGRVLWKGDVVAIALPGNALVEFGRFRIIAIPEIRFEFESAGRPASRPTSYVGVRIA